MLARQADAEKIQFDTQSQPPVSDNDDTPAEDVGLGEVEESESESSGSSSSSDDEPRPIPPPTREAIARDARQALRAAQKEGAAPATTLPLPAAQPVPNQRKTRQATRSPRKNTAAAPSPSPTASPTVSARTTPAPPLSRTATPARFSAQAKGKGRAMPTAENEENIAPEVEVGRARAKSLARPSKVSVEEDEEEDQLDVSEDEPGTKHFVPEPEPVRAFSEDYYLGGDGGGGDESGEERAFALGQQREQARMEQPAAPRSKQKQASGSNRKRRRIVESEEETSEVERSSQSTQRASARKSAPKPSREEEPRRKKKKLLPAPSESQRSVVRSEYDSDPEDEVVVPRAAQSQSRKTARHVDPAEASEPEDDNASMLDDSSPPRKKTFVHRVPRPSQEIRKGSAGDVLGEELASDKLEKINAAYRAPPSHYATGRNQTGRIPWSDKEVKLFIEEYRKFGKNWSKIAARHGENGIISHTLRRRSVVSLKDKARNLHDALLKTGKPVPAWAAQSSSSKSVRSPRQLVRVPELSSDEGSEDEGSLEESSHWSG